MHNDEFKADAVAACMQPASHLLRRWVRDSEMHGDVVQSSKPALGTPKASTDVQTNCAEAAHDLGGLAGRCCREVRDVDARAASMIRIDAMWLAVEPVDMRAGADRLQARVVDDLAPVFPDTF